MSGERGDSPSFEEIAIKIEQDDFPQGKRLKKAQKAIRKRSYSNDETLLEYQKNICQFGTSEEGLLVAPTCGSRNNHTKQRLEPKRESNKLPTHSSKRISFTGSYSSNHCESVSGMESTIGESASSLTFIQSLKECQTERRSHKAFKDKEYTQELAMLKDMNTFKDDLLRCFSTKLKTLQAENQSFRQQAAKDKSQIEMYKEESKAYQAKNNTLKSKLLHSVKFMTNTTSINEDSTSANILHKTLRENDELKDKVSQITQENEILRKLLNLHLENNSFKSFQNEIEIMEKEAQTEKGLIPSTVQEDLEKQSYKPILKTSIRDRVKRCKRKRTESFHYSDFGDTSPEDEEGQDTTLNKLRRKSQRISQFSSGYSMQAIENLRKEAENEQSEDKSAFSSSSSSKSDQGENEDKEKIEDKKEDEENQPVEQMKFDKRAKLCPQKRARIKSSDQVNTLKGISPLNFHKRTRSNESSEDDSFGFNLKKGGGYKMSMKAPENNEESTKDKNELPSSCENKIDIPENDEAYFSSFNKNPVSNSSIKKRIRRVNSLVDGKIDISAEDLPSSDFNKPTKIRYSIHSIIEEEKSKSSSSTSSVKSSDDLTFYFNMNPNSLKRKKSSFCTMTSVASQAQESESGEKTPGSTKRLPFFKIKKYTDSHLNFIGETPDKSISGKKRLRRKSMAIILKNLE
ncbi:unnamed protein product [Moneuplotes crassus]|uniref:Uncharacterized protein n=1 Tax=Euplotes crassus TaxID=5936 RepID=A0AAD1U7A9_EUPCR|nr:unnamed protein product [Moneuplotes crassus]